MTHDELLAEIDLHESMSGTFSYQMGDALRAVIERHFPYREDDWQEGYFECNECTWDSGIEYPCNTIQDITKELK